MKQDCPFCSLKERVIKENKHALLFLSNPRKTAGHYLVAPKRHIEQPWIMTKEELTSVFDLIFLAQKTLSENISEGCDVRQNYRPFLKQSRLKVDHVHYHVLPRNLKDELYEIVEKYETDLFKELTLDEINQYTKLIERTEL